MNQGNYEVQGLGNHELQGEDMHTGDTAHTLAKYKIVSVPSSAQFKYEKFQREYFTLKNFFLILIKIGKSSLSVGC